MGSSRRQLKAHKKAQEKAKQMRTQARDLKAEARELTKNTGIDQRAADLAEQAAELAERVRKSDALAVAQEKGGEYASKAREALHEAGVDERAAELARAVRESDQYKVARENAGEATDRALAAVGGWIGSGPAAEKLGVKPASAKRTTGKWLVAVLGVVAGFVAGMVVGARKSETIGEATRLAGRVGQDTPDIGAPAAQKPIADEVRTRLGEDPRTSDLPRLNINVAEGTVFVRGAVPEGTDEDALRAVIATVPGVEDIDLQLTVSTGS